MLNRIPLIATGILVVFFVPTLIGQVDSTPVRELIAGEIKEVRAAIPALSAHRQWTLGIAGAIFFLGLILGLVEKTRHENEERPRTRFRWKSWAIIAIGILISCLTWWLNNGFKGDHRAYERAAIQADDLYKRMLTQSSVFASRNFKDLEDMNTFLQKSYEPLQNEWNGLKKDVLGVSPLIPALAIVRAGANPQWAATGIGDCNVLSQSEANSRIAATEILAGNLRRAVSAPFEDLQRLRTFAAKYGSVSQYRDGKGTAFRTEMTLSSLFARQAGITSYLAAGRQTQVQTASMEGRPNPPRQTSATKLGTQERDGFIERAVLIPLGGGPVILKAADSKNGWFVFHFNVSARKSPTATITLRSVEIHQGGSVGSTRWSFEFLSNGNRVLSLPEQRWDDSARPTRCAIDPNAGFSGQATAGKSGIELTAVGIRTKIGELE